MNERLFNRPKGWVFLSCLVLSLQQGNAQFVDVAGEIEVTEWWPRSVSTYPTAVHCVVGTNSWQMDGHFSSSKSWTSWFTGTNIVESYGPRVSSSLDGNPAMPVRQADRLTPASRIAWLAFCSGPCLKRKGHQLFPPHDLWKEMISAPSGFLDRTAVFEDALGLPKSVNLYTTNGQPVLQYRVTASTNVLGFEFPLEFYLVQYCPAFLPDSRRIGTNAWEVQLTAKGTVIAIRVGTEPRIPPGFVKTAQR